MTPMLQSVIVSIFLAVITGHPAAGSVFADRIARSVIIKDTTQLLPSYDYVIVGSGAAGLTVADRLSENSNVTVLVIEAGQLATGEQTILVPYNVGDIPDKYFWNLQGIPVSTMNNRTARNPTGTVVGGSTAINGMYNPRGSPGDYDIWEELGNPGWGHDGLLPYFKKSEIFTPPPPEQAKEFGITWDMKYHGTDGPIHLSFPTLLFPAVNFLNAIREIGSQVPQDHAVGIGGLWIPNTVDPVKRTRSFAATGHFEPFAARQNLHLLPGNLVTKVILNGTTATGVQFSAGRGMQTNSISANREVILAAGAQRTPQVLQLSGIGSSDLLQKYNVPVVVDLPGVGANFHDHPMVFVIGAYGNDLNPSPSNATNTTWLAEQKTLYDTKREGLYTTARGNAVAFLPLNETTSDMNTILATLKSQNVQDLYPAETNPTIIEGWKVQRDILIKKLTDAKIATSEFAFGPSITGGLALVKPLSRGSITINSTNTFDFPVLDFATLRNPLDLDMFVAMIQTWRKITNTRALAPLKPSRSFPSDTITTTAQLKDFVRSNIVPTWAHPAGTAAMLKKELGGVVGTDLLVYGTQKLSVVDASIIPVCPSTHTTRTVFAVAEKAADIIKARSAGSMRKL